MAFVTSIYAKNIYRNRAGRNYYEAPRFKGWGAAGLNGL
jgi:hypothetical protein